MKNIWVTTDMHFFHDKLIEYCKRPFDFTNKVFQGLFRIPEDDVLICLGDISMGRELEVHKKFIQPLKCRKILVKGNHDEKTNSWYLNHGWDFVCYSFHDIYFGKKILFSHYPKPAENYDYNIFGHMHNNITNGELLPVYKEFVNEKHLLLALEYTNYQPVKLNYMVDKSDKFKLINMLKEK